MDFYEVKKRTCKDGRTEIYPDFSVGRSKDLMTRGKSFYAVYDKETKLWVTDEYEVQRLIDEELFLAERKLLEEHPDKSITVLTMKEYSNGTWKKFQNFVKDIPDNKQTLDNKLCFLNTEVKKKDYVSKRLPYSLEDGSYQAFDEIIGTLYSPEERAKIEWAIGSIIAGDSKDIQKFIVFYGEAGSGKSTIMNIIQQLFEGYYVTFNAKALTTNGSQFCMEAFRSNPLVAIQHDGDLSRIEDNTRLNSIVSHEEMEMNEKYKSAYQIRPICFLFMGTNKPVKITDAKSGIIRRLIDVKPTNKKIPPKRYSALMSEVGYELGSIASHCLEVYRSMGKNYYDGYRPVEMMYKTDPFFNYVDYYYDVFIKDNGVLLKKAYEMYISYCSESGIPKEKQYDRQKVREELKNYFASFEERTRIGDKQVRSWYSGFLAEKFSQVGTHAIEEPPGWLVLDKDKSLLDEVLADCPAQLANKNGTPSVAWDNVKTTLKDIDTSKTHYVMPPQPLVTVDFDLKDESGKKSAAKNIEEASKWPPTYAEFSNGGAGIHLEYYYTGDVTQLAALISEGIELKVFPDDKKSSLRRRVSKCNDIPIATLSSGLPFKEKKEVVNFDTVKSEKGLRKLIERNLRKEIHPSTKSSIDFIEKILSDAYKSGMVYDVSNMKSDVYTFASRSTNHSEYCTKVVARMKFCSEDKNGSDEKYEDDRLAFYDVEVFPNLFLVNWKYSGMDECIRMINPTSEDMQALMQKKLVGFNCRRYDNHMIYARYLGWDNEQLYELSRRIVNGDKNAFFGEAYNLSYTDVYDFSSVKQSLKKFEIDLHIHHQELGLPWDQPVSKEKWLDVAKYCDNDVFATEAVFYSKDRQADFKARQILAEIAGMTVNDTTNSLTTRIIFGNDRKPSLVYTDLATGEQYGDDEPSEYPNAFPGYEYDSGKNMYRGIDLGRGGYVYSDPGMYIGRTITFDVASMHPSSIIAMNCFGKYTKRFKDILDARIAIKHKDFEAAKKLFDGKLERYLSDPEQASALAQALKIAINSVYGLTSASFENPFKDIRNKNNIVALRGALFMEMLRGEIVEKFNAKVVHIKTDSIKIFEPTKEVFDYIMNRGKEYGYNFEIEHIFDRICLVNDAVYIAHLSPDDPKYNSDGFKKTNHWTATGTEFQQPYVFKTLFSGEDIEFDDLCETKSSKYSINLRSNLGGEEFYTFVGKIGLFCPIKEGCGGGELVWERDGKYNAVGGTKGYYWLESEKVKILGKEGCIDMSYYENMASDALKDLAKFGDYSVFSDLTVTKTEDIAPWDPCPCGEEYDICPNCPKFDKKRGVCTSLGLYIPTYVEKEGE